MSVSSICNFNVATISRDRDIIDAAQLGQIAHVIRTEQRTEAQARP